MKATKQCSCALNLKKLAEKGVFCGYASVFGVVDNHHDILQQGTLASSLRKKGGGNKVKLLWQHHADEAIGNFRMIREDQHGLYVEAQLPRDIQ